MSEVGYYDINASHVNIESLDHVSQENISIQQFRLLFKGRSTISRLSGSTSGSGSYSRTRSIHRVNATLGFSFRVSVNAWQAHARSCWQCRRHTDVDRWHEFVQGIRGVDLWGRDPMAGQGQDAPPRPVHSYPYH